MATRKLEYSRGEVIADKYEVVDLLDENPLGLTYRAKHLKSGNYVRLVLLRPSVAGRDQKDGIIAAFKRTREIEHKNLAKVGELGEHDGLAFYTMEDFEGITLRELLQEYKVQNRQFTVREAAQIVIHILEALHAMHVDTVVMRALRPEHVLIKVRHTGPRQKNFVAQVKVLGAAFWNLVPTAVLAEDEFTRGEAQYLAPELKSFEPTPTPRSDVYSVGVVFYEMLVGQAPIGTFQLPRARRPDLPEHVNDVVEMALAQAPEDRYLTAQDFVNDIQRTFQDAEAGQMDSKPIITPLGWGLALAAVVFIGLIVFNLKPDPVKEAEAADSRVRAEVFERHDRPSSAERQAITSRHPQNMILIPAGPFVRGRLHSERRDVAPASEPLAQIVEMDAYLIDAFEFGNLKGAAPKYNVTYGEAERLCEEAGKRICTANEWEKACKGPKNNVYSYGDTFDQEFCGMGLDAQYKSGTRPDCKSGWGVFDISGNFREWTSSEPKPGRRIVRGGIRGNPVKGSRCALATDESAMYRDRSLAFRCCRDVDAPPVK